MASKQEEASLEPEKVRHARESGAALRRSAKITKAKVLELLADVFDVHAHSGPDTSIGRFFDDWDNARQFMEWGMAGFASKAHAGDTARSATLIQRLADEYAEAGNVKKIRIAGGVCLNYSVGGWNPEAVRASAALGGRFVWTPTLDAWHDRRVEGKEGGLKVMDDSGRVLPEVHEVLRTIAEHDLVLSISHQSTEERFALVEAAKSAGIKRILIDHPQQANTRMTIDQMEEIARAGAMLGIYYSSAIEQRSVDPKEVLTIFERVPHERIVCGSDKGSIWGTHPAEGMRIFIVRLLVMGISEETIRRLFVDNPHRLVFGEMT
ncbi:MAG: hypothetical protein HY695_18870 [Deltaproteobacteria bacterium]|nr:hypothetical protein [Deltaproteobacteria bacterium]